MPGFFIEARRFFAFLLGLNRCLALGTGE